MIWEFYNISSFIIWLIAVSYETMWPISTQPSGTLPRVQLWKEPQEILSLTPEKNQTEIFCTGTIISCFTSPGCQAEFQLSCNWTFFRIKAKSFWPRSKPRNAKVLWRVEQTNQKRINLGSEKSISEWTPVCWRREEREGRKKASLWKN